MVEPIVQIKQGTLKGKVSVDIKGRNFFSFQGIPYAKPPVGDLRFKSPVPAEAWSGIFDATKEGSESLSRHMIFTHKIGSEDCLSINVYTPELPTSKSNPKPVMVWIHGGGFVAGSSKTELYGPEFLIPEDVVVVSLNYRLGILGFLSLEDTSLGVPGNAGLKDMVLALQWVQNNIKQFNGDPNNVTIFGESAGSASCHYLVMSPRAKGLFQRAILQSGVCVNPWPFGNSNAVQIAQVLGAKVQTEKDAFEFLCSVPADKILEAQDLFPENFTLDEMRPFGPVIEKPNPDAFLTEHPLKLMLSGNYNKVPIIIGYTSREGMLFEIFKHFEGIEDIEYRMKDFQKAIPYYYNIKKDTDLSLLVAKKIEDFYYGISETPDEDIDKYYIMNSDLFFVRGIHLTIRAFLKTLNQPFYFYRFNIETELNVFKKVGGVTAPGVSHADDLGYLFKNYTTPHMDPNSLEYISMQRLVKLWTNFAKTGNPNLPELVDVEWPAVTPGPLKYLDFDEKLVIATNPEEERMKFWDDISSLLPTGSTENFYN